MSSQRSRPPAQRVKTDFPLEVTKKAKLLAVLPALLSLYMLYMGISAFRSFHPLDSSRYIFGLPPVALAAVILGCMATMPRKFCRGTIHIRESGVEFNPGDHDLNVHFPWKDLFFSATQNKQQMVRSLVLVHRERKMIFYDLFTRDYDLLVAAITRVKARSNKTQVDGGLKIDSGRIGDIDPRIRGR